MPTKKHKKLDPNWVSSQIHELRYVAFKYSVSVDKVREAKKAVGKNRRKIYNYLRELALANWKKKKK